MRSIDGIPQRQDPFSLDVNFLSSAEHRKLWGTKISAESLPSLLVGDATIPQSTGNSALKNWEGIIYLKL